MQSTEVSKYAKKCLQKHRVKPMRFGLRDLSENAVERKGFRFGLEGEDFEVKPSKEVVIS